jgi:hypothetical protein
MTAACQVCTAPSPNAFLCRSCTKTLHQMLDDLEWWLDRLAEEAVGHVRKGDGGRRGSRANGVKGDDDALTGCTCGHSHHEGVGCGHLNEHGFRDCACEAYVADVAKLRARALAAGRVNVRAGRMLHRVQNMITTIVRDLCETRGVPVHSVRAVPPSFIGPLLPNDIRVIYRSDAQLGAAWLSERITAISADESAGLWFNELHRTVGDDRHDGEIARVLNKPIPMRFLGKCPTWIEGKRAICGIELRCRQDAPEVYCRNCRCTHNPERLQLLLMGDIERKNLTFDKILKANLIQPAEFQISERMIRRWRQHGKLKVHGYLRPCSCGHRYADHRADATRCSQCRDCSSFDGREVPTWHSDDDEPLYRWPDVRQLRTEVPTRKVRAKAAIADAPH